MRGKASVVAVLVVIGLAVLLTASRSVVQGAPHSSARLITLLFAYIVSLQAGRGPPSLLSTSGKVLRRTSPSG